MPSPDIVKIIFIELCFDGKAVVDLLTPCYVANHFNHNGDLVNSNRSVKEMI